MKTKFITFSNDFIRFNKQICLNCHLQDIFITNTLILGICSKKELALFIYPVSLHPQQ